MGIARDTGVAVTAALTLSNPNYSIDPASLPSGLTGNITRLNSVTWTGGASTNNWLTPGNWTGGAVPDQANVANVVIPDGATVAFDNATVVGVAQAGTVALDSISTPATGALTMTSGTLQVANNLQIGAFSQSSGSVAVGGNFTAAGAVNQTAGTLTVTAPVLFGQLHVAPAVTRFVQQHPQLQCRVVLLDRVVNLLEEGFDMGLRIGHLDDSSLVARALGEVRRPVVASPAYLARVGQPQHPRDLQQANCIHRIDGRNAWGPFQEHGRLFDVEVSGQLAFNHNAPAVAACVLGGGFGQFFSYQVAAELQRGELVEVLQDFQGPPTPVQVVYPHARLLPVRARLFIDWMRQELAGFAPEAAPQA